MIKTQEQYEAMDSPHLHLELTGLYDSMRSNAGTSDYAKLKNAAKMVRHILNQRSLAIQSSLWV